MRRALLVVAAAASVAIAVPAAAAKIVTARVVSPSDGAVIVGSGAVSGEGTSAIGVKKLEIAIDATVVARAEPSGVEQEVDLDHQWDSRLLPGSSEPAPNGEHSIAVHAVSSNGEKDSAAVKVLVDNPPARPTGLAARLADGRLHLSWTPNAEPDLLGYTVERDTGRGFSTAGTTESNAFSEAAAPGVVAYRVAAVRSSPNRSGARSSEPSQPIKLEVPASAATSGGWSAPAADKVAPFARAPRGSKGLPDPVAAPGASLPSAPSPPPAASGSYKKRLPYGAEPGATGLRGELVEAGSERGPASPDRARWLALGTLLLAIAGMSRFWAFRLARPVRD